MDCKNLVVLVLVTKSKYSILNIVLVLVLVSLNNTTAGNRSTKKVQVQISKNHSRS